MRRLWFGAMATVVVASNVLMPVGVNAAASAPNKRLELTTSPLPINLVVDPGKTVTTDLRIKSGGPDTERLKITLMKFGAFGDEGKPQILDREQGDDYFDWVKFDRPVFDAPPNVWQTIKMTISVPKTAAFGYYYAVVFNRVGDDVSRPSQSSIAGGTAILVLLEAHVPNAKRQMELVSLQAVHRIWEFLPAKFNVKFKNTGNVHVVPHGNIFIIQGNKTLATLGLNGSTGNVLPNSNRVFPVEWREGFPHWEEAVENGAVAKDKDGQPKYNLVWGNGQRDKNGVPISDGSPPKLRFGKYTAKLFAVYDDGGRDVPLEASVDFWVIPWRFILGLLVALLLIGGGVYAGVSGAWRGAERVGRRRR